MKYCVKCNKQLSDDACFCSKCGSAAVDQLPADDSEDVIALAQFVKSEPGVLDDSSRLMSLLHDVFPGDKTRCRILEDVFDEVGDAIQATHTIDEASVLQLSQLVAQKCRRSEADAIQSVLDWAYVLGKCSFADAQKWRNLAINVSSQILHDASLTTNVNSASPVVANVVISNKFSHPTSKFVSCKAGDYIQFGRYPQNNGNTPEPIDWLVLAREDTSLLVVSKYGLDCKPYNEDFSSVTWEQCTLRKWLNSEFMNAAFSDEEQLAIELSHLRNANNPKHGTNGGIDTEDKLFLLSIDEVCWYLAHGSQSSKGSNYYEYRNNSDLKVVATSYAFGHGTLKGADGNSWFWLRSPGGLRSRAAYVASDGVVYISGRNVYFGIGSVRPALRLILPS